MVWFDLTPHMYWMVNTTGVRFGGLIENGVYAWTSNSSKVIPAIIDSGTSMTMLPSNIYEPFMDKLLKHSGNSVRIEKHDGLYLTQCRHDYFP